MMHDLLIFTLVVGIGSTFALDIWVTLLERLTGLPATDPVRFDPSPIVEAVLEFDAERRAVKPLAAAV